MSISIHPLSGAIGAEIRGVDISKSLEAAEVAIIRQASPATESQVRLNYRGWRVKQCAVLQSMRVHAAQCPMAIGYPGNSPFSCPEFEEIN